MACCPTLLATIEQDLPKLRLLLVGGEACPQNLVARWYRPGRRILNSYGPTEATVTATLTELRPDKPVTIGVPLSTYTIVILDPNEDKTVENGELGEIGIAGVGLALGYMNRDELTAKKFIRDFLNIQNNPSGRIYRTGDLGRIDENGEIEYRGRIDTQVKIRGYRIELNEIEAVLLDLPQIAQAAVTTFEPEPDVTETRRLLRVQAGRRAAARRDLAGAALQAAALHGSGLPRRAAVDPDDALQQGRPQASAEAAARALLGVDQRLRRAEDRERAHPARSAVRRAARRSRLDRASFLRRAWRELAADGARLREHPQEPAHGERVDARHLHQSDDRAACRSSRQGHRRVRRDQARAVPRSVESLLLHLRRHAGGVLRRLCAVRTVGARHRLRVGGRGAGCGRALRPRGDLRGGFVRCADRHLDRRQVAADRPVRGRRDPDLELRLFPLLGREDHDADLACDGLHGHADLQRVSAPDGREDRQGRSAELPLRAGLRRPAVDRRQHDPAQGHDRPRLSRAVELHPHRPGRDRCERLRRRGERHRHQHHDGRRHAARPCLVAAERPARAGRQALSRLACGRDHVGLLPDREPRSQHAAQRRVHRARACRAGPGRGAAADPRLLLLGSVRDRGRHRPRRISRCRCSAPPPCCSSARSLRGSYRSMRSRVSACCS